MMQPADTVSNLDVILREAGWGTILAYYCVGSDSSIQSTNENASEREVCW